LAALLHGTVVLGIRQTCGIEQRTQGNLKQRLKVEKIIPDRQPAIREKGRYASFMSASISYSRQAAWSSGNNGGVG